MNPVSQTVAANIKQLRTKEGLSRTDFVARINNRHPSAKWTTSKLGNVEHAKGEDRAISIDELRDICQAFDVTMFDLTIPSDEPGWTRSLQFSLYGLDIELDDDWRTGMLASANLTAKLRWHPDVVDHYLPFWAEAEYIEEFRLLLEEDDPDGNLNGVTRAHREAMTDFIEAQRRMVNLKANEWKTMKWPPPDDKTVDTWVTEAVKKRDAALRRVASKHTTTTRTGKIFVELEDGA